MLIRIESPYFIAGYDTDNNNIAPIIKYMKNWTIKQIQAYCNKKKWILTLSQLNIGADMAIQTISPTKETFHETMMAYGIKTGEFMTFEAEVFEYEYISDTEFTLKGEGDAKAVLYDLKQVEHA